MQFDLLIRGGRVIDPGTRTDALLDVGFANGRVTAIDAGIPADRARQVVDATGAIVTPGLIDLHTHVYWGGTSLGVGSTDRCSWCRACGGSSRPRIRSRTTSSR